MPTVLKKNAFIKNDKLLTECPVLQQLFLTGYVYSMFLRILTHGSMSEFNFGQKQQQMLLQRILKINWIVPDLILNSVYRHNGERFPINPYPPLNVKRSNQGTRSKPIC